MEKKNEKKVEENIWADPDLGELLFLSEENRENIVIEQREAESEEEEGNETPGIQDPQLSHQLYWGKLQPMLRLYLKDTSSEARRLIRSQVNLILKEGRTQKADGKMGYCYRMEQAINIIDRWKKLCDLGEIPPSETNTYRLYIMLKDAVDNIKVS